MASASSTALELRETERTSHVGFRSIACWDQLTCAPVCPGIMQRVCHHEIVNNSNKVSSAKTTVTVWDRTSRMRATAQIELLARGARICYRGVAFVQQDCAVFHKKCFINKKYLFCILLYNRSRIHSANTTSTMAADFIVSRHKHFHPLQLLPQE